MRKKARHPLEGRFLERLEEAGWWEDPDSREEMKRRRRSLNSMLRALQSCVKALGMEHTHDIIVERLVLALADHEVLQRQWQKAELAFAGHRYLTLGEFRKVEQQLRELRNQEIALRQSLRSRFRYQQWREERAVARAAKLKARRERIAAGRKPLRRRRAARIGKIALR